MKGITQLAHIALKVKDIDKSLDFYVKKMGFPEMFRLEREGKLGAAGSLRDLILPPDTTDAG